MTHRIDVSENPFSNWPLFEQQLREKLDTKLDPDAVARVMARTQRAYAALQLPCLVGTLDLDTAAKVMRFESWNKDYHAAQARMLEVLIDSFVALEI